MSRVEGTRIRQDRGPVSGPPRRGRFSREEIAMSLLLLLVPLTLITAALGWPAALQFFLSVGAVIPLAAYIGWATEALADHLGGKIGGLLNATFGNAPDLLVGVFGVQKGLIPLVKATLIGGLISNSALIMGLCCIVAGLIHGRPRFNREEAGHHSVLMMLTVAAVLFPSAGFAVSGHGATATVQRISVGVAIVLLLAYCAYVAYGIFGWESLRRHEPGGGEGRAIRVHTEKAVSGPRAWSIQLSVAVLLGATVALIPVVNILTDRVQSVTQALGWSDVFVGVIIVGNAGNVAEAYAAIKLAAQRPGRPHDGTNSGLDLALGIASASSIQIATFVAPIVVLYSLTAHAMNLVFSPVEIAILALLVIIFAYIGHDGESNWLEGAQLLALYAMSAILFFALPAAVFG